MQKSVISRPDRHKESSYTLLYGFRSAGSEYTEYNRLLVDHFGLNNHQLAFEKFNQTSIFLDGKGSNPVIIISRESGFKGKVIFTSQKEEGSTFPVPNVSYEIADLNPEAAYRLVMTKNPYRMTDKAVHALESNIILRLTHSINKGSEAEFDKLKLVELRKIRNIAIRSLELTQNRSLNPQLLERK
jgi:hypothetical protein